jgi:hypothetical protein
MSETDSHDRPPAGISEELRPYIDRGEAEGIDRTAERLAAERPIPRAQFRADLRAHLLELSGRAPAQWRPRRLGRLVAAYVGSGAVLLAVAAIGLAGAGPLAY